MSTALTVDNTTAIIPAANPEQAERLAAALEALTGNTRRAYAFAFTAWQRFAVDNGIDPLEPPAAAFRHYLKDRYKAGAKVSTLKLAVAALRKVQTLACCRPTAKDQLVADTITGLEKDDTAPPPRQVAGLTADALSAIRATARKPRKGRRGVLETDAAAELRGNVDIALCQVLADAGLRRSEAASLVWDDVELWTDGSGRLTVRRSKTDTEPRIVYLTPAAMRALAAIRSAEVDGSEPVFGLSVASISRRVKQVAESAGLGPGFSGHSGRVGMARRMAAAGAPTHEIMAQGRWKTARMVEVYTRAEEAGRAAKWLA